MKDVEKVIPSFEIELGGDTVEINASYRTIFTYEKTTGKALARVFAQGIEIFSIELIIEYIHACIRHKNKKYTKDFIADNLDSDLVRRFGNEIFPAIIKYAFVNTKEEETEGETSEGKEKNQSQEKDEKEVG